MLLFSNQMDSSSPLTKGGLQGGRVACRNPLTFVGDYLNADAAMA